MDETVTPLEAGIGWTIGWKKSADFIGRSALESEKARGQLRRRIGLVIDSRRPLRHGDKVHIKGNSVGEITSGGFSPTLGVGIALALVERVPSEGQTEAQIEVRGNMIPARIVKPPFVKSTSLSKS
jgi:aminomethyltransferase